MTALATTLQAFFTDRLARQRQVSPNTIAAYRDTLRLLLVFAADKKGKEPSKLDIDDLDALLIGAFLDDLEHQRKNGARTSAHPQRSACRDPLTVPISGPSPSRSCRPHRASLCRCPSRGRRTCKLPRKRTKAADHPAHVGPGHHPARLACRARRSA